MAEMKTLPEYQVGDVLEIVIRTGGQDKTFVVDVINVDFQGNGLVTYAGDTTGSGAFAPKLISIPTRYQHIVSVKKLRHNVPNTYKGISRTPENMRHYGVG